jgi:hypothetical protein
MTWTAEDLYVESIDVNKKTIQVIDTKAGLKRELSMNKLKDGYGICLIENGVKKEIPFEQIIQGDLINISEEQQPDNKKWLYIWRNKVTGQYQRLIGGNNGKELYFYMSNNQTPYYLEDEFSYSYDNGKTIRYGESKGIEARNTLKEFYNQNVTICTNWRNKVCYIQGNFGSKWDLYGVLVRYGDAVRGEIQICIKGGTRKVYAFEDVEEYDRLKEEDIQPGSIIKYSVGRSGKLKNLSADLKSDIITTDQLYTIKKGDDFGEDFVILDGIEWKIDSNTTFFDYTSHSQNSIKGMKWNHFKKREVVEDVQVIADVVDEKVKFLAVWDNLEGIKVETATAYVVETYSLGDKYYAAIQDHNFAEGQKSQYELDDEDKNLFLDGRIILYGITTDNKLNVLQDDKFEFISGEITDVNKYRMMIEGTKASFIGDCEMRKGNERIEYNELDEGDLVAAYVENGCVRFVNVLNTRANHSMEEGILKDVDASSDYPFIIEVDGEEEEFAAASDIDYMFSDGYLKVNSKSKPLIEAFEKEVKEKTYPVKFLYDRDTDEIHTLWIER